VVRATSRRHSWEREWNITYRPQAFHIASEVTAGARHSLHRHRPNRFRSSWIGSLVDGQTELENASDWRGPIRFGRRIMLVGVLSVEIARAYAPRYRRSPIRSSSKRPPTPKVARGAPIEMQFAADTGDRAALIPLTRPRRIARGCGRARPRRAGRLELVLARRQAPDHASKEPQTGLPLTERPPPARGGARSRSCRPPHRGCATGASGR
jgi:hypothetical protein